MPLPAAISNKLRCWGFYWFACYRGTGGRATYIAPDWSEVHVEVPLSWRTRNYVGTIFGGSVYGAVDPIYRIMLIRSGGPARATACGTKRRESSSRNPAAKHGTRGLSSTTKNSRRSAENSKQPGPSIVSIRSTLSPKLELSAPPSRKQSIFAAANFSRRLTPPAGLTFGLVRPSILRIRASQ